MTRIAWIASVCFVSLITGVAVAGSLPIPLKQGMPYNKARSALINAGWQAEPKTERAVPDESSAEATSCNNGSDFNDKMCRNYEEWDGCGHFCDMYFIDAQNDKRLRVMTDHHDYFDKPTLTGFVKGWEFEKK
jgi:hypothetical protein